MHKRRLTTTLLVAAGLAAGWLWWGQGAPAPGPSQVQSSPAAPAAGGPATKVSPPPPGLSIAAPAPEPAAAQGKTSVAADADPPPGMTAAQWAALAQDLATRPDAAAELSRVRDYLVWSDAVARWRTATADATLAAQVRDGLADRLARREVSAPEARVLLAALLPALEPDAGRQAQALQAFERTLPAPAGADAREQAFLRDQAAAVAAWQRAPASARDAAALQAELERLRRLHFAPAAGPRTTGSPATGSPATGSTPLQERSS